MSKRFSVFLLSALCGVGGMTAMPGPSLAQPSQNADTYNDAGKAHFKERRYLEAYRSFKQAVAISPEGRFYFNVCFSLNYLERFQEAIEACEQVEPNGADPALLKKTDAVLQALRAKVPATPPPVDPNTGTGTPPPDGTGAIDPNTGLPVDTGVDPNTGTTAPPVGTVGTGPATIPGLDPFAAKKAKEDYAWSLGVTLSPLVNLGLGSSPGQPDFYAGGGFALNIFANFMYKAEQRIGLQGYLGVANLPPTDSAFFEPLTILDFGGAAYKHFRITDKIDLTPLVGLHVGLMQPDSSFDEALIAVGLRAQSSVDWYFGGSKQHVLSFSPGINLYSPASSGSVLDAEAFGLESGGATFEIGIGYQFRFTDPFGSGPLFTLE